MMRRRWRRWLCSTRRRPDRRRASGNRGKPPAVDAEGNIYVVTGNGSWDGVQNFSESFLKLSPQLKLLDWFTPTNHFALDKEDNDLDSSGATLIPGTHLVLGGGKEGVLYTLDTRNLGHLGDEHALQHFQAPRPRTCTRLVYWKSAKKGNLLYVWGQRDKAKVYRLEGEKLRRDTVDERDIPNEGHPGAMLSLSANGRHGRHSVGGNPCDRRLMARVPAGRSPRLRRRRHSP